MHPYIEAVTVCVGYADFLEEAAMRNAGIIDRWIIVTTEDDRETRGVCHRHDLECVVTNDHARDGEDFNKGRLIEKGLARCSIGAWRLHLDADIVLPHQFRRMLSAAHLDTRKIYGCDRAMVKSWEDWQKIKAGNFLNHSHCMVNMPQGLEIGTRWALQDTGYVPIGFFQLWHSDGDEFNGRRFRGYPQHHGSACRTDVQHALQWDRRDRECLPEVVVFHLESEPAKLGANWRGRTTRHFGPRTHQCDHRGPS